MPQSTGSTIEGRPTSRPSDAHDAWQDAWFREHWADTPALTEHAYELGLIGPRQYVAQTRQLFRRDLERLLVATVAYTLSLQEALGVIGSRP